MDVSIDTFRNNIVVAVTGWTPAASSLQTSTIAYSSSTWSAADPSTSPLSRRSAAVIDTVHGGTVYNDGLRRDEGGVVAVGDEQGGASVAHRQHHHHHYYGPEENLGSTQSLLQGSTAVLDSSKITASTTTSFFDAESSANSTIIVMPKEALLFDLPYDSLLTVVIVLVGIILGCLLLITYLVVCHCCTSATGFEKPQNRLQHLFGDNITSSSTTPFRVRVGDAESNNKTPDDYDDEYGDGDDRSERSSDGKHHSGSTPVNTHLVDVNSIMPTSSATKPSVDVVNETSTAQGRLRGKRSSTPGAVASRPKSPRLEIHGNNQRALLVNLEDGKAVTTTTAGGITLPASSSPGNGQQTAGSSPQTTSVGGAVMRERSSSFNEPFRHRSSDGRVVQVVVAETHINQNKPAANKLGESRIVQQQKHISNTPGGTATVSSPFPGTNILSKRNQSNSENRKLLGAATKTSGLKSITGNFLGKFASASTTNMDKRSNSTDAAMMNTVIERSVSPDDITCNNMSSTLSAVTNEQPSSVYSAPPELTEAVAPTFAPNSSSAKKAVMLSNPKTTATEYDEDLRFDEINETDNSPFYTCDQVEHERRFSDTDVGDLPQFPATDDCAQLLSTTNQILRNDTTPSTPSVLMVATVHSVTTDANVALDIKPPVAGNRVEQRYVARRIIHSHQKSPSARLGGVNANQILPETTASPSKAPISSSVIELPASDRTERWQQPRTPSEAFDPSNVTSPGNLTTSPTLPTAATTTTTTTDSESYAEKPFDVISAAFTRRSLYGRCTAPFSPTTSSNEKKLNTGYTVKGAADTKIIRTKTSQLSNLPVFQAQSSAMRRRQSQDKQTIHQITAPPPPAPPRSKNSLQNERISSSSTSSRPSFRSSTTTSSYTTKTSTRTSSPPSPISNTSSSSSTVQHNPMRRTSSEKVAHDKLMDSGAGLPRTTSAHTTSSAPVNNTISVPQSKSACDIHVRIIDSHKNADNGYELICVPATPTAVTAQNLSPPWASGRRKFSAFNNNVAYHSAQVEPAAGGTSTQAERSTSNLEAEHQQRNNNFTTNLGRLLQRGMPVVLLPANGSDIL